MIQYILECLVFQLVFLIIYDLFLKRETFFQWNRLYLIATYALSLIIPWIKIEAMKTTVPEVFTEYPEFLWNLDDSAVVVTETVAPSFTIAWEYVFLFGGMILATLFFGFKLNQILNLKRQGQKILFDGFTKYIISNSNAAFSFFKSIFLGDKVIAKEHESIVQHELVHIRQKHSYDLLFFELMRIVGWFNPLVYVYQRRVSELHEFIADAHVAKTNKKEHYQMLLSEVFQTQNISFINQFFKSSLIKKRIVMLTKEKSKKVWKLKYLLLLPLVLSMLAYTSTDFQEEQVVEQNQTSDDAKLIAEIETKIEQKIIEQASLNKVFHNFRKMFKVNSDYKIFTKEQYFESEILTKMHFNQIFKELKSKSNSVLEHPDKFLSQFPKPSTARYNSYVNRKKAFKILDKNLKFSIGAYNQDVTLLEDNSKIPGSAFVFEVANVKDLLGTELRAFNNKMTEIFENEDSTFKSIILKDDLYSFEIMSDAIGSELKGHLRNLNFPPNSFEANSEISKPRETRNLIQGDPVPFATVDEVPIFPGCEDADDKRQCFNESMQKHISKNFNYPQEAQDKGIQGRVSVLFVISKKGKIENLRMRGPDSLLEKEVARIIGKLPKMKPGKHKGKRVDVPFSIPISFKLKEESIFEKLPENSSPFNSQEVNTIRQYNQLVTERNRLLKNTNEKNPIIVNLDEQLRSLQESLSYSLKNSVSSLEQKLKGEENSSIKQYNQLLAERNRLIQSSNEKNPIIVNLDQQLANLKKSIDSFQAKERTTDTLIVPFAVIDKVPVFPSCEDADNKRACFSKMLQKHISKNFNYPKEAQEKGIQGRVAVMFTIAQNGSIQNIRKRGPDKLLENEAERIISLLPKMKPGEHKGKAVDVPFSIPITFKLNDEKKSISLTQNSGLPETPAPLVIIDGKESTLLVLHSMSTDKIKSMHVIKDAAAKRKYGEKGKNGVIEVILKK